MRHRATSSVTATPRMAPRSPGGCEPWAFATGRSRHAHRGRTVMLGGPLLEERLTRGAIDIAFEHDRPPRDATQCALRDRRIVSHQVKLGVTGLRKEWLFGVSYH